MQAAMSDQFELFVLNFVQLKISLNLILYCYIKCTLSNAFIISWLCVINCCLSVLVLILTIDIDIVDIDLLSRICGVVCQLMLSCIYAGVRVSWWEMAWWPALSRRLLKFALFPSSTAESRSVCAASL